MITSLLLAEGRLHHCYWPRVWLSWAAVLELVLLLLVQVWVLVRSVVAPLTLLLASQRLLVRSSLR